MISLFDLTLSILERIRAASFIDCNLCLFVLHALDAVGVACETSTKVEIAKSSIEWVQLCLSHVKPLLLFWYVSTRALGRTHPSVNTDCLVELKTDCDV